MLMLKNYFFGPLDVVLIYLVYSQRVKELWSEMEKSLVVGKRTA